MTSHDAPPGYRIEPGEVGDADALSGLWVELADDQRHHGSHLRAAPNRDHIHEAMLQHAVTDTVLIAWEKGADGTTDSDGNGVADDDRDDGSPVGFVTFGRESEEYAQDVARGIVHNIYVRADDRGAGVGTALLSAAERTLTDRGADAVTLQAMAPNEAAHRFYRRNGYDAHRVEFEKPLESDTLTTDDE